MITASPVTTTDLAAAIRASTHGDVVTPDDSSYPAAAFGIDLVHGRRPEMVVIAADASDVAITVRAATRAGRRVALQSAGRLSGSPAATGAPTILIVTRLLAHVAVDPGTRTATVGAGATWRQVLNAAAPFGLAAVSGPAPGRGAIGHDGGVRPVARSFGFAADHVLELEVVTTQGHLIRVNPGQEPELFESFRRGRPEFGLVTAMTIALRPVDEVYAGGLWFAADDADTVLEQWRELVAELPSTTTTSIARLDLPQTRELPAPLRSRDVVHVRFNHVGDPHEGARLIGHLRRSAEPLLDSLRTPTGRTPFPVTDSAS